MIKLLAPILLLALSVNITPQQKCRCGRVAKDARPHGANEVIEYAPETVSKLQGRVTDPLGEPIEGAIIEVYRLSKADEKYPFYNIPEMLKRQTACSTGKDGKFCLPQLPAGKYMLFVGTGESAGMNHAYQAVTIRPRAKAKDLEIELRLGT